MNNQIQIEEENETGTTLNQKFSFWEMMFQDYFFLFYIPIIILIFEYFKNDVSISVMSIVIAITFKKEIDKSLVFQKYKYFMILILVISAVASSLMKSQY